MSNSPSRRDLKTTVADFTSMYWVWLRSQSRQSSRRGAACGGLRLTAGAVEIHLGVQGAFHPAKKAHPAFRVRNLDQLCPRLTEAGYPPVWDTEIPGVRRFYVSDNLGNRLEFIAE